MTLSYFNGCLIALSLFISMVFVITCLSFRIEWLCITTSMHALREGFWGVAIQYSVPISITWPCTSSELKLFILKLFRAAKYTLEDISENIVYLLEERNLLCVHQILHKAYISRSLSKIEYNILFVMSGKRPRWFFLNDFRNTSSRQFWIYFLRQPKLYCTAQWCLNSRSCCYWINPQLIERCQKNYYTHI